MYENGPPNLSVTSGLRQRAEPECWGICPPNGASWLHAHPSQPETSCLRTERPWNTTCLKGQHRYPRRPLRNLRQTEGALQCPDQSESGWTRVTGTGLSRRDTELNPEQSLQGRRAGVEAQDGRAGPCTPPRAGCGRVSAPWPGAGRRRLERWVDERVTCANPPRRLAGIPTTCLRPLHLSRRYTLRCFPGGHALRGTPARALTTPRKEGGQE